VRRKCEREKGHRYARRSRQSFLRKGLANAEGRPRDEPELEPDEESRKPIGVRSAED